MADILGKYSAFLYEIVKQHLPTDTYGRIDFILRTVDMVEDKDT